MSNSERKSHCGKVKHRTLRAAQIALNETVRLSKRKDPIVTGLSAYKCQYCDGFHVGRSQKKGIDWAMVEAQEKALKQRCAAQRGAA
jgi:hypothetical protein